MSEENIENLSKSDSNSVSTFINHHLLADINFNGHCLINNSIPIPKINKFIYFLHTKSMVKKFKRRFYIK